MFDVASEQAILKTTYPGGIVEVDYQNSKTLRLLKRNKGTLVQNPYGKVFHVPVKHGNPQAGSATYAEGYNQASTEQSRHEAWQIEPKTVFHFADVGGDILRRGEGKGSFARAATYEIEKAKKALTRIYEVMLFKGGFGDLFRLSSTAAVGSATGVALEQKWMVRMVEKGMSIVFSASEAANTLKGITPVKVVGRSSSAGTLDFSAAPNQAGTLAAVSDFGFRIGDRQNSATPSRLCLTGFKAWVPPTAPSATLFNGVNRTADDRLGGLRQNANESGSPEEGFMDAEALVDAEGGQLSHWVCGRLTFNKLAKSMQNHIEYAEIKDEFPIGIPGFRMKGSDAVVYWDSACEEGVAYGFNIDEVEINYAGEDLMYVEEFDGLMFREIPGTDNWRARLVTCSDFILPAPGHAVNLFNL
jgi:hypothetical protein